MSATELAIITQVKVQTDKIPAEVVKTAAIKTETDKIPAEVVKTAAIKTETDKIPAEVIKTAAIQTMTDKIGTVTNSGGTATIGAVLGDAANSSIVARSALIKTEVDKIGTISNAGGTATIGGAIGPVANNTIVARLGTITTMTDKIGTVTNTGGTASIGAILGDAANSSIVARLALIKTDTAAATQVVSSIPAGCIHSATTSISAFLNPSGGGGFAGNTAIASGALTANTYKEVLAVAGSGRLDFAGALAVDTTSRTISIKIAIDGVDICDASVAAVVTASGGITPTPYGLANITFNTSLSISVKSSISETDKVTLYTRYYLT